MEGIFGVSKPEATQLLLGALRGVTRCPVNTSSVGQWHATWHRHAKPFARWHAGMPLQYFLMPPSLPQTLSAGWIIATIGFPH